MSHHIFVCKDVIINLKSSNPLVPLHFNCVYVFGYLINVRQRFECFIFLKFIAYFYILFILIDSLPLSYSYILYVTTNCVCITYTMLREPFFVYSVEEQCIQLRYCFSTLFLFYVLYILFTLFLRAYSIPTTFISLAEKRCIYLLLGNVC